ncbi:MAG: hypothetical protein TQ37_06595 [Candidatus Synechococcus spongiarum 15L]|uniref:Uncharacterized protein n=3 Tax=Candidatus Synechococcus spongiarum TaxID=431041 RepID=A0A1T1D1B1_9SYNE|nr:MAG: hypothetical protein TQ37_06595 [Candidatus Synechococcus spongiarum 15L]OOV34570.1 hypothetical protein BV61_02395 [Candidatus Synechococcus spongiarum LMB bulk15M]OOV36332.1 hypothetical protein BV53_01065 [Candidatus Synechococcus spongiarum LMB bulk15N]
MLNPLLMETGTLVATVTGVLKMLSVAEGLPKMSPKLAGIVQCVQESMKSRERPLAGPTSFYQTAKARFKTRIDRDRFAQPSTLRTWSDGSSAQSSMGTISAQGSGFWSCGGIPR